jgi:glutathionylspermidine synthase
MTSPWLPVVPLDDDAFVTLRRRAIFDCDKWDPQVGDACVIARHPLVITREAWAQVSALAEALALETAAAEAELVQRQDLQRRMGLWRTLRHALARAGTNGLPAGCARLMRFDFHFTRDGWRISEVNSDVPGGLNESSGFARLMATHYPQWHPTGDPVGVYAQRLSDATPAGEPIALVHATAFTDDQQMMRALARRLQASGRTVHLASPAHVRWREGAAWLVADWWRGPLGTLVRFFPAEWMPALPRHTGWTQWFFGSRTPMSNPATAILTQYKRFPLIWDRLRTPLPAWRALLPDTQSPREVRWRGSDEWVLKPVLGRAGDGIGVAGVTASREMRTITRQVRWWPRAWIAQRRFDVVPLDVGGQTVFPCLGVYTLDGRVIGAYGRVASRPLIDANAADAAVLAA